MKKIIALTLVIIMLISSLTACSLMGEDSDIHQKDTDGFFDKVLEPSDKNETEKQEEPSGGNAETEKALDTAPTAETRPLSEAADAAKIITQPTDGNYDVLFDVTQKYSYGGYGDTFETSKGTFHVKANGKDRYVKYTLNVLTTGGNARMEEDESVEIWYVNGVAYVETRKWTKANGKTADDVKESKTLKNTDFYSVCSQYGIFPFDVDYLTSFSADFLEDTDGSASWADEIYTYAFVCDKQQKKDVASAINTIRMVGSRMHVLDWPDITNANVSCTVNPSGHLSTEVNVAGDIDTNCSYKFNSGSSAITLPAAAS